VWITASERVAPDIGFTGSEWPEYSSPAPWRVAGPNACGTQCRRYILPASPGSMNSMTAALVMRMFLPTRPTNNPEALRSVLWANITKNRDEFFKYNIFI
jgi:hypothetical protein